MVLFCSAVFWGGLFVLFLGGFQFIGLYVDLGNTLVEYFFSMFFLSLLIMLFFSTGIIVYTTLFHSREAAFLLTTPASADRIFAYKFAEAIGFSSWGFFLLGSPLMVAYGLTVKAPAAFYAMFLVYLFSFVLVPGSVGAVAAILVANLFPRRQKTVLALSVAGVLAVAAIFGLPALAHAGRDAHRRLAGQCSEPAGVLPASPLAQPLDVGGPARLGQGRLVAGGLPLDGSLGTRGPGLPGGRCRRARPLSPRLQPRPGRQDRHGDARGWLSLIPSSIAPSSSFPTPSGCSFSRTCEPSCATRPSGPSS